MLLDANMTIGERFKHIRTEKGFSQSELAEGICSKSVVSHLENDRAYPSASMFGKLADKLGVPLREIMGMQEKQLEVGFQIEMVRVYIEKADYNHALKLIEELDWREADLLEHQRVELLISRSQCLIKTKNHLKAIDLLSVFLEREQTQQTVDNETLCKLYNKLGNSHFGVKDFEKAYSAYEQAYRISHKLPVFGLITAQISHNLGLVCNQLDKKEDAQHYLLKSYSYYESISEIRGVADSLFELAIATGSTDYMTRAHSLYESLNMVREANIVIQHYAFHVDSKTDLTEAIRKFESSVSGFENLGDFAMCTYVSSRAAIACLRNEDIGEADRFLVLADRYKDQAEFHNEYLLADYYRAKAMYNLHQRNFDQCILDSQTSSEICDRMGLRAESAISLELTAEAYHQKGEVDSAYRVSKRIIDLLRPRRSI